jgi:myo-inositol-1(or 4)-monophosphatase
MLPYGQLISDGGADSMSVLSENDITFYKSIIIEAGGLARDIQKSGLKVSRKDDRTIVTQADLEVQNFLIRGISGRYENINFILEEGAGGSRVPVGDKTISVIIDPIDGTAVYSMMLPTWSVSIGIFEGSRPLYGFVYSPGCGMLFHNDDSRAYLNNEPVEIERGMKIDSETNIFMAAEMYGKFSISYPGKIRNLGSSALHASLVADNRRNRTLAFFGKTYIWDVAGAVPIVMKAKGEVRYINGEDIDFAEALKGGYSFRDYLAVYSIDDFEYIRGIMKRV